MYVSLRTKFWTWKATFRRVGFAASKKKGLKMAPNRFAMCAKKIESTVALSLDGAFLWLNEDWQMVFVSSSALCKKIHLSSFSSYKTDMALIIFYTFVSRGGAVFKLNCNTIYRNESQLRDTCCGTRESRSRIVSSIFCLSLHHDSQRDFVKGCVNISSLLPSPSLHCAWCLIELPLRFCDCVAR